MVNGQFEKGNQASLQHGQRGMLARSKGTDTSALSKGQLSRLAELKIQVSTPAGVLEGMRALAAGSMGLVEWGEAWLNDTAENEGPVAAFTSAMMARHLAVRNTARADLVALDKMQRDHGNENDARVILDSIRGDDNDGNG